ncbi:MAG: hypothetical protein A2Y03_01600 [Omnitrophica WOR_2 bacterium GWF2_38_59]|nr:MAG: hypothetical protein A2Y06_00535 [Omnitrophica WOR_2 bacterium GWA2_37_7]OGX25740.1 MAG: hypothetical protein A2Y03_01600 [Omnitrophica WOR_2 bacterium GWF2_38_59]OGX47249.1 MAG: hypothetical protein A2243_03860 [Omnitrophica WOR_2 bacterium RIFOXYA2_FULL_38_17]OGX51960.1 MAG: hypothetical protein A2267_08985 [Omnitrophica WOR_2 bacterium RIFOXYA12_FULL_38_10]OGX58053.1 MAG: hypothetical protein A2306_04975 [Omnitrophica WOR_2 bacterium RIFOXYB2_FULL_38_16]HBG61765.1 hypothetical prote
MIKIKKRHSITMIFVFVFIFVALVFRTFSKQETDWSQVEFSADRNAIRIFDRSTGKIYVYTEFEGKLEKVWILDELGQNMRKLK